MALKRGTGVSGLREDIGQFGLTTSGCTNCAQYEGDTLVPRTHAKGLY